MKIVFFPTAVVSFDNATLDHQPLGGTETAIIRLSQALKTLGHKVIVMTETKKPSLSDPLYLPYSAASDLGEIDVLIAVREWKSLFFDIKAKIYLYWTGDSYDQMQNIGIGDKRISKRIDRLLAVSSWHAKSLSEKSGFPLRKTRILRNGVHLPYFEGQEQRQRKRLIYSSAPYRGLSLLPAIFEALKTKHPEAELHVFSGFDVYGGAERYYQPAVKEYQRLSQRLSLIPGCFLHGNISQQLLAREFMKSALLLYPNTFEETSCITAMEAQAAGCVVVSTHLAALPETVGKAGILIKQPPGTDKYQKKFIEAVDSLLSDDSLFKQYSKQAILQSSSYGWQTIASDFSAWLEKFMEEKGKHKL